MEFKFRLIERKQRISPNIRQEFLLTPRNWDDYSFKTLFEVDWIDSDGETHSLGNIKIGYVGQPRGWTKDSFECEFSALGETYFSLGQDIAFYKNIHQKLKPKVLSKFLKALNDITGFDEERLASISKEDVFLESLTRGIGFSGLAKQARRVLKGLPELTDFHFSYLVSRDNRHAEVNIDFKVIAGSIPSTNLHVLIGRNGVGKTFLLNSMVNVLMGKKIDKDFPSCHFFYELGWDTRSSLPKDYFGSVISVSFSAFDPFCPPEDRQNSIEGPAFFYIGMKNWRSGADEKKEIDLKKPINFVEEFVSSLRSCFSQKAKKNRWFNAVRRLESDANFADMELAELANLNEEEEAINKARKLAPRMSSGHSIVLLTITRLVDTVQEKTLVLIDEPESHLHPPLLSAFMRALSDLLHDRNGVAIIATHSPVVVQEVPKSCVWKLMRIGSEGRSDRPERETFGENVGVLTKEIFGLEVSKSGFHELLQNNVDAGGTYESILDLYKGQLGAEAKAILMAMVHDRDQNVRQ